MTGFDALEHCCLTDVGVRRSHNQDAHGQILARDEAQWAECGHVFVVADGMGGHAVGEKASAKAARDIPHTFQKHAREGTAAALRRAFAETNAGIHAIGQRTPEFEGMGTTATAIVFRTDGVWIGHVGDSRAYRVRAGRIQQLTYDHSFVWELARRQRCLPEEVQGVQKNVIIRSIGPEPLVQADIEGPYPVRPGDTFVVCSDGLTSRVSDAEIGMVASHLPPNDACRVLVDLANLRGGPDNITVLVVRAAGGTATASSTPRPWWASIPWPLPVLGLGFVLAVLVLVFLVMQLPGVPVLIFLDAITLAAGLIGLGMHTRAEAERARTEEPPTRQSVYRDYPCRVERPALDRLYELEVALVAHLRKQAVKYDAVRYQRHVDAADALGRAGDLAGAFVERCKALTMLAAVWNQNRGKEEVFSPKWDRPSAV